MRKLLLVVAFVLVAVPASAQQFNGARGQFPGCPKCGVISALDWPLAEATVSASNLVFAGWGFECVGGTPADRVDVWYEDYQGKGHPLKQEDWTLFAGQVPRQDVVNYYKKECPNVPLLSGWHLVITNPPPTGLRRVIINVWYGPYREGHRRTYLVTQ